MSHPYKLACLDCREYILLGKLVDTDLEDHPISWRFTGWMDLMTGKNLKGMELWSVVERFLILHRGHEVRVMPDLLVEELDPQAEYFYSIDNASEIFARPVEPKPDPVEDVDLMDSDDKSWIATKIRR